MNSPRSLRSMIATLVAAAMFTASIPLGAVRAEMVPTDRIIGQMEVDAGRAEISSFLARDDLRQRITAMGITPEEAEMRVASLSDAEVMQLAGMIDSPPAGQDLAASDWYVIAAGFAFLIILIVLM